MAFLDAPHPRDHTGGALVRGRICVAAGQNGGTVDWPIVPQTDCFDPVAEIWNKPRPPDHTDPRGGSAYRTSCDGRLLVAGGERSTSSRVDAFNGTHWQRFQYGLDDSRHASGLAVDCICNLLCIAAGSGSNGGAPISTTEGGNIALLIFCILSFKIFSRLRIIAFPSGIDCDNMQLLLQEPEEQ